jgi:hypothetical protein
MTLYTPILVALGTVVGYWLFTLYRGLSRNIALAKSSGLPYVIMPWNVFSLFWLSSFALWLPLLKKVLPTSLQGVWIE